MNKAARFVAYTTSFVAARGTLFASPLILASLLPTRVYGAFEWAHATATLIGTVIALGAGSVLPLAIHNRAPGIDQGSIVRHFLVVASIWAVGALVILPFLTDLAAAMIALLTPIILLQSYFGVRFKSTGRAEASLWMDTGLFLLATIATVAAYFSAPSTMLTFVLASLAIYGVALYGAAGYQALKRERSNLRPNWSRLTALGLPLMLASLAATLVTTSGRFGVGIFYSLETTATYSALFRGTAVPVIGHQLILTALFRQAYSVDDRRLDRTLFVIPLSVGLFALLFWIVSPWLAPFLGPAFEQAFQEHRWIAAVLLAQTLLWSGVSINDLAAARQQVARKILPLVLATLIVAIGVGAFVVSITEANLETYVIVHFLVTMTYFCAQAIFLRRQGVILPYLWTSYVAGVAVLLCFFGLTV